MTEFWSAEHLEAMAWIRDQRIIAALAGAGTISSDMIADGSLSLFPPSTSKILAAISEPLGLPGASLPAYGVPGDGCCRNCLRPPVHSQGLCVYCDELEPDEPGPACSGARVRLILLYAVACALWMMTVAYIADAVIW